MYFKISAYVVKTLKLQNSYIISVNGNAIRTTDVEIH